MPNPVTPADPGLLASLADQIALPGYAVRNLLRGDVAAAAKNAADFGLNMIDAALPGDLIPQISEDADKPQFRQIVDVGDDLLGNALNFAGDVATDPLTYVPGAAVAKGAGAVGKVARAVLPKAVQDVAGKAAQTVRSTFGAQRVSQEGANALRAANATKDAVERSGGEAAFEGLKGASQRELETAGEVLHKLKRDEAGRSSALIDPSESMSLEQRLMAHLVDKPDLDPQRILGLVKTSRELADAQLASGQAADFGGRIFTAGPGAKNYFPRQFTDTQPDELLGQTAGGNPSAIKGRTLERDQDVLNYLAENPNVDLEFDVAKALTKRTGQQAELAKRAEVGRSLFERAKADPSLLSGDLLEKLHGSVPRARPVVRELPDASPQGAAVVGPSTGERIPGLTPDQKAKVVSWFGEQDYRHADPLMRSAAEEIAKQLPTEEAKVMLTALRGMAPRGAATNALSKLNRYFKPYAVYGAVVPKLGSITRNLTGGLWQQMSNAEARGALTETAPTVFKTWLKSVDDGVEKLFGRRFTQNEFAQVDSAYKNSGGDPRKVLAGITDPTMREAVQHGVLGNNYVDTEALIKSFDRGGWRSLGSNLMDYPGAMFKGAEQRMRYGLYKSLRAKHSPEEAARIVSDTFYDYTVSSAENRLARDLIPFFQFSAKAIPQQAKFLAEKPSVASWLANLYAQGGNEPVMPNMEGRLNLPIGRDEAGNRQFLTNLGLPFEAANLLPNPSADPLDVGRQVEQNIVGSSQPLLKALYAYTSGRDPYFASTPGTYTKVAGQDLGTAGSVINQVLNSGLPFASAGGSLLSQAGRLADERTSGLETAASLLTGARVQSVDQDRALQLRLQELLERTPSVQRFTQLYDKSQDPETQDLLKSLREAKANIKAKKATALPSN